MLILKGSPIITTIVLHNTAVSRLVQFLQLQAVENHHKQKWGYLSELGKYTGYNFFCEPTGKRTQCRKIGEETIAQIGNNCDVPGRCGMISYCWAGYFKKEKPTQLQVDDFIAFIREVQEHFPDVVLKQHKDVYPSRSCAELSDSEIQIWMEKEDEETPNQLIASLKKRVKTLKKQNTQLVGMVTLLISILTKK